ncbi:carbohydrate porin [Ralstonia sp. 25C]|uniref:carbohydrate porin n=1 Tax=Ralstonia sp. 25C TaxID=3447363 RepID=UPI003F74E1AC
MMPPFHARLSRLTALSPVFALMLCAGHALADDNASSWAINDPDRFAVHGQATYVWQHDLSFHSPYSGQNSLSGQSTTSYSVTTTLDLGMRLWQGAEVHINPEVAFGKAFSELHGLGGFSNGELAKTAGADPTVYRARAFFRQTVGLGGPGGDREDQEAEMNQFAGPVDKRRLVFTAGNFSVLDVFDSVTYAHDPRTQFLNWSFLTHGAFDYAADARGYTSGAALEYYDGDWAYRLGRFIQPIESNGLALDTRVVRHYGDVFEVEHSHTLAGQPGKLRVMLFRNKANMARYDDALALGQSTGSAPDINLVRRENTKVGIGIGGEQQLYDDIGLFARASWADGKTETYSFTEIDRAISFGAVVRGSKWGRSEDTVGLAAAINMLSPDHRRYLQQGGMGVFLGDGKLNYAPEQIVEAFYSFQAAKHLWVSADVQWIRNPGYNADRGPAVFFGTRLHTEF